MARTIFFLLGPCILLLGGLASGETFEMFRGVRWGADKNVISDLIPGPQKENVEVYTRKEPKKIGDIEVESIYYVFYKDKFGAAMINFQGASIAAKLKEALIQKYGAAEKPDPSAEKFIWNLSELRILFTFLPKDENGSVEYYFKPIVQQRQEDKAKTERKIMDDL